MEAYKTKVQNQLVYFFGIENYQLESEDKIDSSTLIKLKNEKLLFEIKKFYMLQPSSIIFRGISNNDRISYLFENGIDVEPSNHLFFADFSLDKCIEYVSYPMLFLALNKDKITRACVTKIK